MQIEISISQNCRLPTEGPWADAGGTANDDSFTADVIRVVSRAFASEAENERAALDAIEEIAAKKINPLGLLSSVIVARYSKVATSDFWTNYQSKWGIQLEWKGTVAEEPFQSWYRQFSVGTLKDNSVANVRRALKERRSFVRLFFSSAERWTVEQIRALRSIAFRKMASERGIPASIRDLNLASHLISLGAIMLRRIGTDDRNTCVFQLIMPPGRVL